MHVIAVNRYYWPDHSATAQMLTDLAKHLVWHGHRVSVVTSRLVYEGGSLLAREEVAGGVQIKRVRTTRFGRAGILGRIFDYLTFYVSATWAVARLVRRGDVVIVKTDPPLLSVPIALLRPMKRFTLVNWCQDLFPETAVALGMRWADGWMGAMLRSMRNWALRQAAFNAVLNTHMERAVLSMGVPASRICILENWADAAIKPVPHELNPLRREWELENAFVIGYSGNLGRAHMPERIAELVRRTKDIAGLAWLFIGGGTGLSIVREAAKGASNVHFKPYQARERLSFSLSAADAHLISLYPVCEGYVAPSKLYGIMAAGRPIISLGDRDGDIAGRVTSNGGGCVLDPDAPDTWANEIHKLRVNLQRPMPPLSAVFTAEAALECWRAALERQAAPGRRVAA